MLLFGQGQLLPACCSGLPKSAAGSGGIRTHASEETGALNQRLRPLGHATLLSLQFKPLFGPLAALPLKMRPWGQPRTLRGLAQAQASLEKPLQALVALGRGLGREWAFQMAARPKIIFYNWYQVRMAEWSKALRSGRSPLLWAWVRIPLLTCRF